MTNMSFVASLTREQRKIANVLSQYPDIMLSGIFLASLGSGRACWLFENAPHMIACFAE